MSFNIWEGIYSSFSQCPKGKEISWSKRWVDQQTEKIKKLKTDIKKSAEYVIGYKTSLLPVLTAAAGASLNKDKLKILDFGGGLGNTYLLMNSGCIRQLDFEFHIVEGEQICKKGKELFKDDRRIHFYSALPQEIEKFDIIHCCSSLQYIEDWKGLFKSWAAYEPVYILIADLPAGKIPTYATVQNYYESKIPYWFFNIDEIIEAMNAAGYSLIFKSAFNDKRLGIEQPMPQDNFPKEYRLGETCNLLFIRMEK
jgi:putative methyltransferase (TIGR04325 family)